MKPKNNSQIRTKEVDPFFISVDDTLQICSIHYHIRDQIEHEVFTFNKNELPKLLQVIKEVMY